MRWGRAPKPHAMGARCRRRHSRNRRSRTPAGASGRTSRAGARGGPIPTTAQCQEQSRAGAPSLVGVHCCVGRAAGTCQPPEQIGLVIMGCHAPGWPGRRSNGDPIVAGRLTKPHGSREFCETPWKPGTGGRRVATRQSPGGVSRGHDGLWQDEPTGSARNSAAPQRRWAGALHPWSPGGAADGRGRGGQEGRPTPARRGNPMEAGSFEKPHGSRALLGPCGCLARPSVRGRCPGRGDVIHHGVNWNPRPSSNGPRAWIYAVTFPRTTL